MSYLLSAASSLSVLAQQIVVRKYSLFLLNKLSSLRLRPFIISQFYSQVQEGLAGFSA